MPISDTCSRFVTIRTIHMHISYYYTKTVSLRLHSLVITITIIWLIKYSRKSQCTKQNRLTKPAQTLPQTLQTRRENTIHTSITSVVKFTAHSVWQKERCVFVLLLGILANMLDL